MAGRGIHLEESLNDMIDGHKNLWDRIKDATEKELFAELAQIVRRTKDKRVEKYRKSVSTTINEIFPKIILDALGDWWESEDGLPAFLRRKHQDEESIDLVKSYRHKDDDAFSGKVYKKMLLIKTDGLIKIDYDEEKNNVKTIIKKYLNSIEEHCKILERDYRDKDNDAEEYESIAESFSYIIDSIKIDELYNELTKDIEMISE